MWDHDKERYKEIQENLKRNPPPDAIMKDVLFLLEQFRLAREKEYWEVQRIRAAWHNDASL